MPADSEGTQGCFDGGGAESPGGQREGVPGFTSALGEISQSQHWEEFTREEGILAPSIFVDYTNLKDFCIINQMLGFEHFSNHGDNRDKPKGLGPLFNTHDQPNTNYLGHRERTENLDQIQRTFPWPWTLICWGMPGNA